MIADVAVLIVAYRSRTTIPGVFDALARQTVRPSRVRVLENGSPEGEAVDPARLPDWAELVVSDVNLGFAAGNNRLAEGLGERWIVLLNPDAFPEPDWLERLLAASGRYPDVALFGCTQHAHGAPGVLDGAGDVYHVTGLPYRAGYGRAMSPPPDGECFGPCGAAAMIRRDVWEGLGGFDEDYFCYIEDVDLAYRARLAGYRAVQVQDAAVSHMGYASSGRRSTFATYHGARNRFWTFFKNTPTPLLWLLAPVHLGVTLLLWLSAARFGQFVLFGEAMRDALAGWPRLMEKRRAVQATRVVSSWTVLHNLDWNLLHLLTRAPSLKPIMALRATAAPDPDARTAHREP